MRASEKKFLVLLAAVLFAWRVCQLPAVQNAFLQFIAVGQVPGTNILLAPDQVFIVLAALFSISLLLIFRKELLRSLGRARRRSELRPEQDALRQAKQKEPEPKTILIIKTRRKGKTVSRPALLSGWTLPVLYVPSVRPLLRAVCFRLRPLLAGMAERIVRGSRFAGWLTSKIAVRLWCWAEPSIRHFDRWLEKELHRNPYTAQLLELGSECWKVLSDWRRKA